MSRRILALLGGSAVVLALFTGALYLLTRESSAVTTPGSAVYGVLFLFGVVMLVAGRLQLPGNLAITGWRARWMGLTWVLPLLLSFGLPRLGEPLAGLTRPISIAAVIVALVVGALMLVLTARTAEHAGRDGILWRQ